MTEDLEIDAHAPKETIFSHVSTEYMFLKFWGMIPDVKVTYKRSSPRNTTTALSSLNWSR